VLHSEDWPPGI